MTRSATTVTATPDEPLDAAVLAGLRAHNAAFLPPLAPQPLRVYLHEDAELVGGVLADTWWGWLDLGTIWVRHDRRGAGHGRSLVRAAEAEALRRGCTRAMLDTFSADAARFWHRLGYVEAGRLEELPPGVTRVYFRKWLGSP